MPDLLYLSHRIPYPPFKGEKIRPLHIIRHLRDRYRIQPRVPDRRPRRLGARAGGPRAVRGRLFRPAQSACSQDRMSARARDGRTAHAALLLEPRSRTVGGNRAHRGQARGRADFFLGHGPVRPAPPPPSAAQHHGLRRRRFRQVAQICRDDALADELDLWPREPPPAGLRARGRTRNGRQAYW